MTEAERFVASQNGGSASMTEAERFVQSQSMAAGGASDSPPSSQAVTATPPTNRPVLTGIPAYDVAKTLTGWASKAANKGIQTFIDPAVSSLRAEQEQVGPGMGRLGARATETGYGVGRFFASAPDFANRFVNPEEYGSTAGEQGKEAIGGLWQGIKQFPAQVGEGVRMAAEDIDAAYGDPTMKQPNITEGLYRGLGADSTYQQAVEAYRADPSAPINTALMVTGGIKGGLGAVRKAGKVVRGLRAVRPEGNLQRGIWYRGEDARNASGDRFYSASKDVAGDFGKVTEADQSTILRNPLIVESKEALSEKIGYAGDPMAEPKDITARFDDLAKQYAIQKGYDGIIYENGTMGERELHSFEKPEQPIPPEVFRDQENVPRPPSGIEQGKAVEQAQPVRSGGKEAAQTSGVVQRPQEAVSNISSRPRQQNRTELENSLYAAIDNAERIRQSALSVLGKENMPFHEAYIDNARGATRDLGKLSNDQIRELTFNVNKTGEFIDQVKLKRNPTPAPPAAKQPDLASKSAVPEVKPAAKQPWEMKGNVSNKEAWQLVKADYLIESPIEINGGVRIPTPKEYSDFINDEGSRGGDARAALVNRYRSHAFQVKHAVETGLPVPSSVLAEYGLEGKGKPETPPLTKPKGEWVETNRGRSIYEGDIAVENAKEEYVAEKIFNAPSYPKLKSAVERFNKSLYGKEGAAARLAKYEQQPWDLLTAHAGVMNARSQSANTMRVLADNVFKETKLPRRQPGTFRGEDRLDWDKVKTPISSDIQARQGGLGQMSKAMEPGAQGPTTINDIRQHFEQSLKVPIRTGKFSGQGGRGAQGIFKTKADVIRLKDYGDVESLSHEVAHAVENRYPVKQLFNQFKDELGALDYEPARARSTEGFAEYLRHYMTGSGDAAALAPKFTQAFETFLGQHPDLKTTISQGKKLFDSWRSQGAVARFESGMVSKPQRSPIGETLRRWKNTWLYQMFNDRNAIGNFTKDASQAAGQPLRGRENPADIAKFVAGKAAAKADNWINYETTDYIGQPTGEGLRTILKRVEGNEETAINYARAKHSIERWAQGKNPGADLADAKYYVEKYKSPEFEQFSKEFTAFNNRILKYYEDAGGIDPAISEVMREMYESYTPLLRDVGRSGGAGGGTKYINTNSPIKRAHGGGEPVINPLAGTLKKLESVIKAADDRRVGGAIISAAKKYPGMGRWAEQVQLGAKPTRPNVEQAVKSFGDAGIDISGLSPEQLNQILTSWRQRTQGIPSQNVIPWYENGKHESWQINKELAEGLAGVNAPEIESFFGFATYPKKMITAGATGLRPGFSLLTNPLRDPWSHMMQSRMWWMTPIHSVGGILRNAIHKIGLDATFRLDPKYHELIRRVGADQAQFYNAELPKAMENAKRLIADNRRSKTMNLVAHPVELFKAVMNIPEGGPRAAEFKAVYDKVFKETGNIETAVIEASNAHAEATMDFKRGGALAKKINRYVPFFNPVMQEPGLIARSFRRAPVATTIKGIVGMTLPTIALWYTNRDKDWYKATPTWQKAAVWLIRVGPDDEGGWTLRLPKPFLWGSIFASWPESILDAMYKRDPEIVTDMMKQIGINTIPSITPAIFAPIGVVAGEGGYDFFRGRPIVPQSQVQNLPPEERYGKYTSETAKTIGGALGVSPTKVDYVINAYTGGMGGDVIQAAEKPFTDKATSDGIENAPMVGRLVSRSPYIDKFYDELTEYQDRMKEIDLKPVAKRTQKEKDDLTRGKTLERIGRQLSDLRKQVTTISKSDKSGEVKGREIDALNKKMEDIAHKAIYPTAKPRAEVVLPDLYGLEHLDSIPANLTVRVNVIHADTGKRIEVKRNARQVIESLNKQLAAYRKVYKDVTGEEWA